MITILPPFTPYKPGDPIVVDYMDADFGHVTDAHLKVDRCVKLANTGLGDLWRVTVRRLDGKLYDATVDEHGNDRYGRVRKPEVTR